MIEYYCLYCDLDFISYNLCNNHELYCKNKKYCQICYEYGHSTEYCYYLY